MAIDTASLHLLYYPSDVLRARAEEVDLADPDLAGVIDRMVELMIAHKGVGLAAPQVGVPWRLFITRESETEARAWINPVIEPLDTELEVEEEGCLSLPDIRADIRRPRAVSINAADADGEAVQSTSDDFESRIWQHEYDHLDGILIIDRMSPMGRLANRRAIRGLERAARA